MKQTKNQTSTYSCAGQKLTVKAEYISYQRFFGYKFESIIISSAQNSVFYTSCLATMCPVCFIGHNVACLLATMCLVYFIGHNVPCLFHWPQCGQCIYVVGHKVANAFALRLPHSLFLATKWPMRLVFTLHQPLSPHILAHGYISE